MSNRGTCWKPLPACFLNMDVAWVLQTPSINVIPEVLGEEIAIDIQWVWVQKYLMNRFHISIASGELEANKRNKRKPKRKKKARAYNGFRCISNS